MLKIELMFHRKCLQRPIFIALARLHAKWSGVVTQCIKLQKQNIICKCRVFLVYKLRTVLTFVRSISVHYKICFMKFEGVHRIVCSREQSEQKYLLESFHSRCTVIIVLMI
eukprot:TRINITY_DN43259_c0_g1_i2.p1 TRINITY_DN43259_c0_g1~~TRINITY_DN43259_c0_g1_i2.p1  ORF type:complete len:111 (-),score=3.34 TRINITY_DN43259_c0_g1_i2:27-359(-)